MRTSATAMLFALTTTVVVSTTILGAETAFAGKRNDNTSNSKLQEVERQREEAAQREAERQREEAKRQAERQKEEQREEAKREAERQMQAERSTASKSSNKSAAERSSGGDSDGNDASAKNSQAKDKARADSDDNEQKPDDDTPSKGTAKADRNSNKDVARAKVPEDAGPPRTLVDLFQRMKKSVDPTAAETAPAANGENSGSAKSERKTNTKAATRSDDGAAPAQPKDSGVPSKKAQGKVAGSSTGNAHLLAPGSDFQRVEVLAVAPKGEAVAKAKALGFRPAEQARFSGLGLSVTKLVAPDGMSAAEAQTMLAKLELGPLAFNRKYRIYRAAANTPAAAPARPEKSQPVPMDTLCGSDRCYGSSLIGWRPEHRSCAARTRIGIIDTAVDRSHPTFRKSRLLVQQVGSAEKAARARAPEWHGTGVLAVLAGDLASDTPGLVPDAQFMVADAFYSDDDGQPASDTLRLLSALDWLEKQKAEIVNLSLAGPPDDLLKQALDRLSAKGMIFVAAAGNDGPTAPPNYPAAYPNVIAVTAVGRDLRSYRHANRGPHIDIAAPGVQIWTALPGAGQGYHSGTSFAVPYVTAAIASNLPLPGQRNKAELMRRLEFKDLGDPGRDPIYGHGLLLGPSQCGESAVAASANPELPWLVTRTTAAPNPKNVSVRPAFAP